MTVVITLTWGTILEFGLWMVALGLGVFLLSRCYVARRNIKYKIQRRGTA